MERVTHMEMTARRRTMRRRAGVRGTLLGLVGLVLIAGAVSAVVGRSPSLNGPIYTIAEVRAGLRTHPQAWVGRTVWVEGKVGSLGAVVPMPGGSYGLPRNLDYLHPPPGVSVQISILPPSYDVRSRQDTRTVITQFMAAPHLGDENPLLRWARRVPVLNRLVSLSMTGQMRLYAAHAFRLTLLPVQCRYLYDAACTDAQLTDVR